MFKKIGQKLIQGAKAEILNPETDGPDWDKILKAVLGLAEIGIFAFAMLSGRDTGSVRTPIIINNYIQK